LTLIASGLFPFDTGRRLNHRILNSCPIVHTGDSLRRVLVSLTRSNRHAVLPWLA